MDATARAAAPHRQVSFVLTNEFASVEVSADWSANGPRLRVENRQNGRTIHLDPLELASLTWLDHSDLGPFLDPSQTGWRNAVVPDDEGACDGADDS